MVGFALGVVAAGHVSTLLIAELAASNGPTALASCGSFAVQAAVFPDGVVAHGTSSPLQAQPSDVVAGVIANAGCGTLPVVQGFALPRGAALIGSAGTLIGQTLMTISGRAANGTGGLLTFIVSGLNNGVAARGGSGLLRTTRTTATGLVGGVAFGQARAPVGQAAAYPLSVSSGASAGSFVSHLAIIALPLGIVATATIGDTHGWLIIFTAASALPAPHATTIITASARLAELPEEVTVYAVPQVIQLVYPVKGLYVDVFAVPQLVNTVINDG